MAKKNNKKEREKLFAISKNCHWCNCSTLHPTEVKSDTNPRMATLDRILDAYGNDKNYVLSCRRCNRSQSGLYEKEKKSHLKITLGDFIK